MKANIHPEWHPDTHVTCACGNKFTTGSVLPEIRVEVCSACHPFFTGQMRYVDTTGRVDRFNSLRQSAQQKVSKKEKRVLKRQQKVERELLRPTTLQEVRSTK